jgi:hypothetical protein
MARVGVALLTWCVYSAVFAPVFFGASFAAVFAAAMQGDIPIRWTGIAVIGLLALFGGLNEIRREGHELHVGSVVWSMLVVPVVGWLLLSPQGFNHPLNTLNFHIARMVVVGWGVSNVFNFWLQFRDVIRRRRRPVVAAKPVPMARVPRLLRRRRVSTEWVEEIEGHGIEAGEFPALRGAVRPPPRVSPDVIEHGGNAPQITYVRQPDGSFVEVPTPHAVPVDRRR